MGKELIEAGAAVIVGLLALWYMGVKPKETGRRSRISRVLK